MTVFHILCFPPRYERLEKDKTKESGRQYVKKEKVELFLSGTQPCQVTAESQLAFQILK